MKKLDFSKIHVTGESNNGSLFHFLNVINFIKLFYKKIYNKKNFEVLFEEKC